MLKTVKMIFDLISSIADNMYFLGRVIVVLIIEHRYKYTNGEVLKRTT